MMAQKLIDITGEKRNKLTVLGLAYVEKDASGKSRSYWYCKCDCGNVKILRKDTFYYPYSKVKSCGCWHKEENSHRPKEKDVI